MTAECSLTAPTATSSFGRWAAVISAPSAGTWIRLWALRRSLTGRPSQAVEDLSVPRMTASQPAGTGVAPWATEWFALRTLTGGWRRGVTSQSRQAQHDDRMVPWPSRDAQAASHAEVVLTAAPRPCRANREDIEFHIALDNLQLIEYNVHLNGLSRIRENYRSRYQCCIACRVALETVRDCASDGGGRGVAYRRPTNAGRFCRGKGNNV